MPDSLVRTRIEVVGGSEAIAQLLAYKTELAGIGSASQATTRLGVDTSALKTAQSDVAALSSAHQALGSNVGVLKMDTQDLQSAKSSIADVRTGLAGMKGDAAGAAQGFAGFGPAGIAVGVAAAALAGAAIEAAKFQQSMQNVQAVLHASAGELANLGASIQANSRDTIFTANQIAEADRQLAKAGQDANQIISEQRDVLNLASAAQVSATEGATAYVTAMKDFNLTASDSKTIADDLAKSTDSSVGSLADMTQALQQVGPVAQQAGLDLKTTTAAIADLENAGLQGDAGSALKIFLTRLESPTKAAQQAMNDLGLSVYDTNGQLLSLSAIFDQIQQKTRGLDDETKNMDLTKIFGARGVRVADIASSQGSSGLQDVINHENQIGDASDIAATKLNTLSGQLHQLESSLNVVAVNIGSVALPQLKAYAGGLTDVANIIGKVTSNLGDTAAQQNYAKQQANPFQALTGTSADDLSNAQASIDQLKDKIAQVQAAHDSFGNRAQELAQSPFRGGLLGGLIPDIDQTGNQLTVLESQLTDAQKKYDAFKQSVSDDPSKALSALNSNISAIEANQISLDQRSGDNIDAIGKHADEAKKYIDSFKDSFISSGHSIQDWQAIESAAFQDIDAHAQQTKSALEEAGVLLTQQNRDAETRRATDLAHGAPERLVNTATFGEDFGLTKQQIADANIELKKFETEYTAGVAAQKANDAAQLASAKQRITDEATADKAAAADLAATQTAAATKSADAWKAANAEIGKIDLSKGIESLGALGAGIDKVQSDLAALGESDPALTALVSIVDGFAKITDAENKASVAYQSYMGLLSESDTRITALDALKKKYDDAADAALKMQKAGQPITADQQALISSRPAVDANITAQIGHIQTNQAGDLVAAVKVAPDSAGFDDQFRQQIAAQGGAPAVAATVKADTKQAESDLTAFEKKDRQTIITVKADLALAQEQIDNVAKARTADLTIVTHFVDDQGRPTVDPTLDPARGYGESQTGANPYYQTPLPASDPRSSANLDNPGGPGAVAGAVPLAAGGGGAMAGGASIRYSDYQKVVGQYPGSPLNNQASFNDLTSVAAQMGVDPRVLMAIMQTESGYGANAGLIGKQYNYGGMGVNDRGYGHDSGVHATDGGPEYAGYSDFKSFLMDISAWVKQNGTSFSNYQTADQGQGKNSTLAQLQTAVPLVGGSTHGTPQQDPRYVYGADGSIAMNLHGDAPLIHTPGNDNPNYDPSSAARWQFPEGVNPGDLFHVGQGHFAPPDMAYTPPVASASAIPDTGATDTAANTLRDQIVQKALASVGQDKLVNYCEQFVEETVQAITGKRGATGQREGTATQAFQHAQSMGLEVSAAAAQPGDLVYYPDANGGPGHVAVYKGKGEQVSTYDGRPTPNGDQYAVHTEAVNPGARYISVGLPAAAAPMGTAAASAVSSVGNAASGNVDLSNPNSPAAQQALAQQNQDAKDLAVSLANVTVAAGQVNKAFAGMNPPEIAAANAELLRMQPILEKNALAHGGPNGTAAVSEADKQLAVNAAWGQSLEYEAAYAKLLTDTINHTGDLAADTQHVADIVGGPMAAAYGQAAAASAQIAASQAATTQLTDQHNSVVAQRQAADTARARGETDYQNQVQATRLIVTRGIEDAAYREQLANTARQNDYQQQQRANQDAVQAQNDAYTVQSRAQEDKTRYLQFYGSEQKRQLQNSLFDQQEAFTKNRAAENSQSQLLTADAKGASTNQGALAFAAQNAALKDRMATEDDANTKATTDNQHLQMLENRKSAQEQYDLQTITIAQQRANQDTLAGLAKVATAQGRTYQDQSAAIAAADAARAHSQVLQQRQWADADKAHALSFAAQSNQIADTRAAEDKSYQASIAAQKQITAMAQASLDSANQAIAAWQATGVVIDNAAQSAASAAQNNYAANPAYTRRLGTHYGGGIIPLTEPYSIVGDGPGGQILPTTEVVSAPGYAVTPIRDLSAQNGGTATPAAPTWNITIVQQPGEDAAALWARLKPMLDQYQQEQSAAIRHAAMGGAR
jgi:TP901 family phage tail tape measure protein